MFSFPIALHPCRVGQTSWPVLAFSAPATTGDSGRVLARPPNWLESRYPTSFGGILTGPFRPGFRSAIGTASPATLGRRASTAKFQHSGGQKNKSNGGKGLIAYVARIRGPYFIPRRAPFEIHSPKPLSRKGFVSSTLQALSWQPRAFL